MIEPPKDSAARPEHSLGELAQRVDRITRENARLFQELVAGERRYRRLARAVWAVQEEERRKIARELHDGLGQDLTALKIQLELLAQEAGRTGTELEPKVRNVLDSASRVLEEARELSHLLRPQILDDLGLVPALRWLARTLQERTRLDVELSCSGLEERLEPELETVVFRVVQEALTNVAKHAGTGSALVELHRRGAWAELCVADGGRGFDAGRILGAEEPRGSGLGNMRDRVELLGGTLRVRTAPEQGTRVEIRIPLDGEEGPA